MGLITNATLIVSSTTFVGYYALRHLKTIVKEIQIPKSSILFRHFQRTKQDCPERWHSADAFEAKLPANLQLQKDKSDVDTYVKLFYSSMAFKIEKTIMRVLFKLPEPDLSKFDVGNSVYLWKVVDRNDQEVLLAWQVGSVQGTTWFCIPGNENSIMFGSSFETLKTHDNAEPIVETKNGDGIIKRTSTKINLLKHQLRPLDDTQKPRRPLEKLVSVFSVLTWPIVVSFHKTYSLILLYSVSRKFYRHMKGVQK